MEAAGQNGIPTAFLVDPKGRIAWIGHPMTLEEKVLSQVISGTYDLQKAAADFADAAHAGAGEVVNGHAGGEGFAGA